MSETITSLIFSLCAVVLTYAAIAGIGTEEPIFYMIAGCTALIGSWLVRIEASIDNLKVK